MNRPLIGTALLQLISAAALSAAPPDVLHAHTSSGDGAPIAYTVAGTGEPTLVFIHCGYCDRTFWEGQLESFGAEHRVVALDLAGHGDSGDRRGEWTLGAFGEDVAVVVRALELQEVILVGSSLGGPVALEAARLLGDRVLGVVAVDTLHNAEAKRDKEASRARIERFRDDFPSACNEMIGILFHPGADAQLVDRVQGVMCGTRPEVAVAIQESFFDYDMAAAMGAAGIPIRAIFGDLFPINTTGNRRHADFEAVVLAGVGHFPMLEAPADFDRQLAVYVEELAVPGPISRTFSPAARPKAPRIFSGPP